MPTVTGEDRSKTARTVLAFAGSFVLLGVILAQADVEGARRHLERFDWRFVGVGVGLSAAVLLSRVVRFQVLFPEAAFVRLGAITALQNFFVRVMPFRLGELSFPILLKRHLGESAAKAVVYLLLVRLLELWLLVCAALWAVLSLLGTEKAQGAVGLVVGLAIVSILLVTFGSWLRFGVRVVARLVERLPPRRSSPRLVQVVESLTAVVSRSERLSPAQRAKLLATSVVVVVLQYMMLAVLARAFGVELGVWQAIVGISLAQAASALPIATVGTFGAYEAGWTAGLVMVGLPIDAAVVSGVATQLSTLVFACVFAAPAALVLQKHA